MTPNIIPWMAKRIIWRTCRRRLSSKLLFPKRTRSSCKLVNYAMASRSDFPQFLNLSTYDYNWWREMSLYNGNLVQ
jgi:hypothetical protein